MSIFRTNKKMKRLGDFPTRSPKKDDFTEYVYSFADGTQTVISRSELSAEVDDVMYEEMKTESNNNEVQIEKHRGYAKDEKKQEALINMQRSKEDLEENVIQQFEKDQLWEMIRSLEPQQQDLIYQKYIQGKSNTQIANDEVVTEGAIRDRLRKINKQLEKKLKRQI